MPSPVPRKAGDGAVECDGEDYHNFMTAGFPPTCWGSQASDLSAPCLSVLFCTMGMILVLRLVLRIELTVIIMTPGTW